MKCMIITPRTTIYFGYEEHLIHTIRSNIVRVHIHYSLTGSSRQCKQTDHKPYLKVNKHLNIQVSHIQTFFLLLMGRGESDPSDLSSVVWSWRCWHGGSYPSNEVLCLWDGLEDAALAVVCNYQVGRVRHNVADIHGFELRPHSVKTLLSLPCLS